MKLHTNAGTPELAKFAMYWELAPTFPCHEWLWLLGVPGFWLESASLIAQNMMPPYVLLHVVDDLEIDIEALPDALNRLMAWLEAHHDLLFADDRSAELQNRLVLLETEVLHAIESSARASVVHHQIHPVDVFGDDMLEGIQALPIGIKWEGSIL